MLYPFFAQAAQSPRRQLTFRHAVAGHLVALLGGAWAVVHNGPAEPPVFLGNLLLIAGIVEGAFLIGWRLTQLPKSQALEFLFVSPLRPWGLLLGEALVGLGRLALVTLTGLPVLAYLAMAGYLVPADPAALLVMPLTWGAITGLGLTTWAYEPRRVRVWAERVVLVLVIVYLVIGVVVGENLIKWLRLLPEGWSSWVQEGFIAIHLYNPFGVIKFWLENYGLSEGESAQGLLQMVGLELAGLAALTAILARAASRLKGHFDELQYRPMVDESRGRRGQPGDRPLSWWAVRRVTEYSGRINLVLAVGFGTIYALYTVAGENWPPWLGRAVFEICETKAGGIPGIATALVVLAAVPAAFQYGLWDSNIQERCRRLELLLLTRLDAQDYWHAAAAAAGQRGWGYFAVAALLWLAAALAGKVSIPEAGTALAAGVILWGLYFALGFRAFARGLQANGFGVLLTVGLPLLTYGLFRAGWPVLAMLLPPGSVYGPAKGLAPLSWLPGPLLGAAVALVISRQSLASCENDLRLWYDRYHGRKGLD